RMTPPTPQLSPSLLQTHNPSTFCPQKTTEVRACLCYDLPFSLYHWPRFSAVIICSFFPISNILIGAPKANTSQPNVIEGGSVFFCPWSQNQSDCSTVNFDNQGKSRLRDYSPTAVDTQVEFKSYQWFGATVRSHGNTVLACAPRYYWRTEHDTPFSDATGTCYLSVDSLKTFVEYAPCRTERHGPAGQGYCQGGFSADFTKDGKVVLGGPGSFYWQGQLISATTEEIVKSFYPSYFLLSVTGQIQTRQVQGSYDDSYLGELRGEKASEGERKRYCAPRSDYRLPPFCSNAFQMGSYFGYAVAATDINNDGLDDLVVGAPMFMRRGSAGQRWEEVGRVYVFLQRQPLLFEPGQPHLAGSQAYGRFGSSLAPLGDLNQDGFNDIAIGCPFGGDDQQGLVFIYNGHANGVKNTPTQTLAGQWACGAFPASFGFALRGNTDLDQNGYPDLIVGAFGVDKAVLYRARPIVNASASLTVQPTMINPEEKSCLVSNVCVPMLKTFLSMCFYVTLCHVFVLGAGFLVEVQLDVLKQTQKESVVRRTLFLESQQPSLLKTVTFAAGGQTCYHADIFLRSEGEFRDKLSPIYVSLNFSLDPHASLDRHGLRPILNHQTTQLIEQKAQIQLDCGEDNICVPDLKLSVYGDRTEVYLGDENSLTLTFNARNEGEGGAYEAELYVLLPPEADYSGIARNNASLTRLTCSYEAENQTRYLLCDLGNPMKSGTSFWAGLRFTVPRLEDTHSTVQFELQIRRYINFAVSAVSRPDKLLFPPPNWKMSHSLQEEQEVGPEILHVYELVNNGPSMISRTVLELQCPLRAQGHVLLYPLEVITQGQLNCTSNHTLNALRLKVREQHTHTHEDQVHRECGYFCVALTLQVLTTVLWNKPDSQYKVPWWIILLAILAGLLLLSLLIYALYKLGFFKRADPYGTAMEKAQLKPQASSEA
uniref:Integrin alpha-2 domain-containing protein n=1 Tax=Esox lucius TaxID=8010 RepID=A0A6Q2YPM8_ESOLU